VTALSQPGQGGSDLFATSASGRIQEVFSMLNVMRKVWAFHLLVSVYSPVVFCFQMCGRGGQTSKFDMSSSETAVTERSARCMQVWLLRRFLLFRLSWWADAISRFRSSWRT
jgi:hypothetical protein